ncbi:MAG: tetratricopeptide repeat protein [Terriglobales bacterium]
MINGQLNTLSTSPNISNYWHRHFRLLILEFIPLVIAIAAMAAQSPPSRAAAIHEHLHKAEDYLRANDASSAATEFEAVLTLDPKNAEAYANLGVIAFFQRDYQKASQDFRKALAIDPSLAKTQALLGISQERLGDVSAGALLEKSFAKLQDKQLRVKVGIELANLYQQQGETERAVPVVQKLVDLDPDSVEILYMAQRLYQELAEDTLNKLAVLAPGSARMQQVIAERDVNGDNLKGAIEHYRNALRIEPRLAGVHYELAEAILEAAPNDADTQAEAEKELAVAAANDGDSAKVRCEYGRIAMLKGELDEAHRHYAEAFRLDRENTEAQLGLGRVLMMMEKPEEARKYLELAVKGDPLNATAHYRLAQAYKRLSMTSEAAKELHLFDEIKKSQEQVRQLYRQMNQRPTFPNESMENEQ